MTGQEVRAMILDSGVKIWQVANAWGVNDGNFARRLRKDFSAAEVKRVKAIIKSLARK